MRVKRKHKIQSNRWPGAIRLIADLLLVFLALHLAIFLRQSSPLGEAVQTAPRVTSSAYWFLLVIWGIGVFLQFAVKYRTNRRIGIIQILYSAFILSIAEYLIIGRDNPSFSRLFIVIFPITNLLASFASWRFSLALPELLERSSNILEKARTNYKVRVKVLWKFPLLNRAAQAVTSIEDWFARYRPPKKVRAVLRFIGENQRWVLPLILLFMTILFFWPGKYFVSSDAAYYLSLAKNLFHGHGYVNPDLSPAIYRGPVLPILISATYSLFGDSFRSALLLERIFWVLTVLATYFLGKELFGSRVGLLAALFVMFAGAINYVFSVIWTDGPLLFFLVVLHLVIWKNFKNQRGAKWYVLMGVLMGLAYLLKQTVLFLVPLPLLLWLVLREYRTRQNLLRLLLGYLVFACFFFGWMGYVYISGGSLGQVTREINTGLTFLSFITNSVSSFLTGQHVQASTANVEAPIRSPIEIMVLYYRQDLAPEFPKVAILFPIALLYLLYQTLWKRSRPDIFLALGILLFATLIPTEVNSNIGTRHSIYFFTILLIACSAMLVRLLRFPYAMPLGMALTALVATLFVWGEASASPAPLQIFTPKSFARPVEYFAAYTATADWINQNIDPSSNILAQERDGNVLHILTSGNRKFEILNLCEGEAAFQMAQTCKPPYILFWINRGITDPNEPRDNFYGISENWLIPALEERNVDYVIVTPSTKLLYYYLDAHPSFEEVFRANGLVIFEVNHPVQFSSAYPEMSWETCIGPGTSEYLQNLKREKPLVYEAKLERIFGPWMGLSRGDIENFENWEGCTLDAVIPEK